MNLSPLKLIVERFLEFNGNYSFDRLCTGLLYTNSHKQLQISLVWSIDIFQLNLLKMTTNLTALKIDSKDFIEIPLDLQMNNQIFLLFPEYPTIPNSMNRFFFHLNFPISFRSFILRFKFSG